MADSEISAQILEFFLRQPIADHVLNPIVLALPLSAPLPPRLLKTLLLRRLASHLASSISSKTLDTLELIEQLDRDHDLAPSPSPALQLAYAAVAVDLTTRWLREDGELGDFFDSVNRIWNCRVRDMEGSEAKGLVSRRLREERRLIEEAVVNMFSREELMGRDAGKEAAGAVAAYLKEAAAEMGPTFVEIAVGAALRAEGEGQRGGQVEMVHGDAVKMTLAGNGTLDVDGCSTSRPSDLCGPNTIQEKRTVELSRDKKGHDVVEEPLAANTLIADGVPTIETENGSNLERVEEHQDHMVEEPLADNALIADGASTIETGNGSNLERLEEHEDHMDHGPAPCADRVVEVTQTRDVIADIPNNGVQETVVQPCTTDQNPAGLEKENQNLFDGNPSVSSLHKGKEPLKMEGTRTSTGRERDIHGAQAPTVIDGNPTAIRYKWHDNSGESSPDKSPEPSERLQIPHPKRRKVAATKVPWNKEFAGRRKKKWWSVEEEDTLREAVDKYGAGNWSSIKNSYPGVFEDRTTIDLKDKWRNMTR